jgi:hypothetical protein
VNPQTLSSASTFYKKVVLPFIWIFGFGLGTLMLWLEKLGGGPKQIPAEMKWLFLFGWMFGSAFIWWRTTALKKVRLDGKFLYVSNYVEEIAIPLAMIEKVTESRWNEGHPITVHLLASTEFGDR